MEGTGECILLTGRSCGGASRSDAMVERLEGVCTWGSDLSVFLS